VLGLKVTHVPYRGAAPAMQDLIAGRIDYQCALLPAPLAQIESQQVKALAILTKSRSPVLPNVATAEEQGIKEFDASAWHAIFMVRATPAAIIKKVNEATGMTLDNQIVSRHLMQLGAVAVPSDRRSPDYLKGFVRAEIDKWSAVIKSAENAARLNIMRCDNGDRLTLLWFKFSHPAPKLRPILNCSSSALRTW